MTQGGESLHKEFNRFGCVMQGVQNETEKLLCTMKEHHTSTGPIVQSNVVHPKKRKKPNSKRAMKLLFTGITFKHILFKHIHVYANKNFMILRESCKITLYIMMMI